jgi:uncharacterized protein DUF222
MRSTWAQMLSVVAEIESRSMAPGLGYGSTVELVRAIARIPRSEAQARVNTAADVLPSRGINGAPVEPKLPTTAAAVADAAIGAADVAVIRSVLARIPSHLGEEKRAEVEAELARHARTLDAGQLAILGRRILAYLDQDGRRPNDTPETRRSLRFHDRDGGYELAGWLDREAAEILRFTLSPWPRGARAPTPKSTTHQPARTARPDRLSVPGLRWPDQRGRRPRGDSPRSRVCVCGMFSTRPLVRHSPSRALGDHGPPALKLYGALRPAPPTPPPFSLANPDGRRYPRIPSTTLARRPTTHQPRPHRPQPDPNPPVVENSCAHVPP